MFTGLFIFLHSVSLSTSDCMCVVTFKCPLEPILLFCPLQTSSPIPHPHSPGFGHVACSTHPGLAMVSPAVLTRVWSWCRLHCSPGFSHDCACSTHQGLVMMTAASPGFAHKVFWSTHLGLVMMSSAALTRIWLCCPQDSPGFGLDDGCNNRPVQK